MTAIAKNRLKSTWTPLSHEETNVKIFEERRALVGKWFDKWTDQQRRIVLQDVLAKCKIKQLEYSGAIISEKIPVHKVDFTRRIPRVLSLYIFSFLDPRSLCRAAKVCWFWKYLTEADQVWMPKCLKLGWYLSFIPSPYETGIWKRNYIEHLQSLQYLKPKEPHYVPPTRLITKQSSAISPTRKPIKPQTPVAWRRGDPTPQDTWRYNYLDNDDELEKVLKLRKTGSYGPEAEIISAKAKSKVKTGLDKENIKNQKNKKTRSTLKNTYAVVLSDQSEMEPVVDDGRPKWATHTSGSPYVNHSFMGDTRTSLDAGIRPPPVDDNRRNRVTPQDVPSSESFGEMPWKLPPETVDDV